MNEQPDSCNRVGMQIRLWALVVVTTFNGYGQNKMPYQFFDVDGRKTTYKKLIQKTAKAEVVLFGEQHDNSMGHWLQLKLIQDLVKKRALVLGFEMIEADNQKQLDQYLQSAINQKAFDTLARLWPNYKTDYKPLVDFAKEQKIPVVATNIPRRYASMVFKNDFQSLDALSDEEKRWIAPLPIAFDITLPGYYNMLDMMGGHAGEKMPKAQAMKDATMAHFILQNLKAQTLFIHYHGTYHSDHFEGIYWYLKREKPSLQLVTIAMVSQKDIAKLEKNNLKKADFILVIDEDVTKTY